MAGNWPELGSSSLLWTEHAKAVFNSATVQFLRLGRATLGIPIAEFKGTIGMLNKPQEEITILGWMDFYTPVYYYQVRRLENLYSPITNVIRECPLIFP